MVSFIQMGKYHKSHHTLVPIGWWPVQQAGSQAKAITVKNSQIYDYAVAYAASVTVRTTVCRLLVPSGRGRPLKLNTGQLRDK